MPSLAIIPCVTHAVSSTLSEIQKIQPLDWQSGLFSVIPLINNLFLHFRVKDSQLTSESRRDFHFVFKLGLAGQGVIFTLFFQKQMKNMSYRECLLYLSKKVIWILASNAHIEWIISKKKS